MGHFNPVDCNQTIAEFSAHSIVAKSCGIDFGLFKHDRRSLQFRRLFRAVSPLINRIDNFLEVDSLSAAECMNLAVHL